MQDWFVRGRRLARALPRRTILLDATGPWFPARSAFQEGSCLDRFGAAGGGRNRRSAGGARVALTERVTIRAPDFEATGWTLNVSRGGLRAVVGQRLQPNVVYEIAVGDQRAGRRVRLVWSRDEQDGQIVGLEYLLRP
jgi:hypothetical protein